MLRSRSILIGMGAVAALSTAIIARAALAQPCPLAFLSTYLSTGFSCTLEDKTLSDFTYTQNTGAPSPTVVTVSPETAVLHNPGLVFNFTGVLTVPTAALSPCHSVSTFSRRPMIRSPTLLLPSPVPCQAEVLS